MQLLQAFDANQFDPTQSAGSLPIGKHPVVIESSEVKANKNNDGGYLQLNLRITDGPQAGSMGAYRLNLYHSMQTTVEIANRQLSAICHVTGVFRVDNSEQLHNIPFIVEVGPQKNDPTYTEVKKVFDMNGNEPTRGGQGGAGAQPQPQPQQQQQQQQQAPTQNGGGWGGGQQQQNQQSAQQQTQQQPAWGGQQQQQPQPQQQQQGGWQQNNNAAPAGGQPAPWGQR